MADPGNLTRFRAVVAGALAHLEARRQEADLTTVVPEPELPLIQGALA